MKLAAAAVAVAVLALPVLAEQPLPGIPARPRQMDPALKRSQVRDIQQQLAAMGYEIGPVDGTLGSKTRAGIQRFQSDHGLTTTGDLTERTVAAIEAAKASPTAGTR